MALFATGNILGFSSVSIPALLNKDSEIKADADDMSWMGKVMGICSIILKLAHSHICFPNYSQPHNNWNPPGHPNRRNDIRRNRSEKDDPPQFPHVLCRMGHYQPVNHVS